MLRRAIGLVRRYRHLNWTLADQSLVSGVNFLTSVLIVRVLGLDAFGRFSLAWMAVMLGVSLGSALIISPMMAIGPKQPRETTAGYYGAVLLQQLGLTGLALVIVAVAAALARVLPWPWPDSPLAWVLPVGLTTAIVQLGEFFRRYLFVRSRPSEALMVDVVSYGGRLALLYLLLHRPGSGVIQAFAAVSLASLAGILVALTRLRGLRPQTAQFGATMRRHWRFARWLCATAVMEWVSGNAVLWVVGLALGAAAIGLLRATQNLVGVINILFLGFSNFVPVRAGNQFAREGTDGLIRYLRRITAGGAALTGTVLAVVLAAPLFWYQLMFGAAQEPGIVPLVYVWGMTYLVEFSAIPFRVGLGVFEHSRPIFLGLLAQTLLNLGLAAPLIHWLGPPGAVVAFLTGATANVAVISVAFLRRLRAQQTEPAGMVGAWPQR